MNETSVRRDQFGPLVADHNNAFDFTPLFEDTILSLTPSILILLIAVTRIVYLKPKPQRVLGHKFQYSKVLAFATYACIQLALLVLFTSQSGQTRNWASISAACLSFVNSLVFCWLSYLEHARNIRPSSILLVYLFFSTGFDVVRLQTMWRSRPSSSIVELFTTSTIFKGLILALEAVEKTRYLPRQFREQRPEETSSILNRGVFFWLNRILWKGARSLLLPTDMYELNSKMTADHLGERFRRSWEPLKRRSGKNTVLLASYKTLKWQLLAAVFPRVVLLALTICQPLLLQRLLDFLEHSQEEPYSNTGAGLVAAYAVVYLGAAIATGFYWHYQYRMLTMLRGCLISALSWHTTRLDIQAISDPKSALTLMSTDMGQIEDGLKNLHEFWANTIQVGLATYLLKTQMGTACVVPLLVSILAAIGTAWVGSAANPRQMDWMKAVERRINLTSSMLSGMKEVRMKGLTEGLSRTITSLRGDELSVAHRFRRLTTITAGFGFAPEILSASVTFLVFLLQARSTGEDFNVAKAFTSLSLIAVLTQPLNNSFQSIPGFLGALASLQRIDGFLRADEQKDFRDLKSWGSSDTTSDHAAERVGQTETSIPLVTLEDQLRRRTTINTAPGDAFRLHDGCFGWSADVDRLQNINVSVPSGRLTFVIGPVASGKSTFCKTLLGETQASKGSVQVNIPSGGISFCEQTAYLINGSIKKNIVSFEEWDADWYHSVVAASALEEDISNLPQRHNTLVGSGGVNLSGGQKHKVAFARALYARNPVIVLDDIFSGLDAASERHIFYNAVGPRGLARRQGMTVVFATHAVKFLPFAEHIITLGPEGDVTQEGSFAELRNKPGYVANLDIPVVGSNGDDDHGTAATTDDEAPKHGPSKVESISDDTVEQDLARQTGEFSVYQYYFRAAGWWMSGLFLSLGTINATVMSLSTVWVKKWTDTTSHHGQSRNFYYWGVYTLIQSLALTSLVAFAWTMLILVQRVGRRMHRIVLSTVVNAPLAYFSSTDSGTTLNRFSQDMHLIDGELPLGMLNLIFCAMNALGQGIIILISSPWTGLSYPIILVIFYAVQKFYLRTSRQLRFLDLEAKSPLYTHFLESITGLSTIRAFGWTERNLKLGQSLLDKSQKPAYLMYMIQRWLTFVMDTVVACLAVLIATLAIVQRGNSGFAGLAMVQVMSLNLMLRTMIIVWTGVETSIGAVSRVKSFSEQTSIEHHVFEVQEPPTEWPSEGRIEFRSMTATYETAPSDQPALNTINLVIKPGEKIGVCGRSGSGKSSLILSLFRMIEIQSGTIVVDSIDLRHVPRNTIRARLNALPQHPLFLHGTVRENLDPSGTLPDGVLINALKKVTLWDVFQGRTNETAQASANASARNSTEIPAAAAASVEEERKKGTGVLDTILRPDVFSHGQRQLFSLASAILRCNGNGDSNMRTRTSTGPNSSTSCSVVVLDEVTSNVDHVTDELMQRIIREEFEGKTVIAVAHRLNTIADFDRVAVFSRGELVEVGDPKVLLTQRDSTFAQMWSEKKAGGTNE